MPTSPFAPAGQMSDPMQRGTTPFYSPNDPLQARPNATGVSLNTRDLKSPAQPMSNGIMRTQYEEHIPGGTTTVLPSGDPLATGTPPTNDIEYRTGGYYSNPTVVDNPFSFDTDWTWQVLPSSIIYKSYLASLHESAHGQPVGAYQQSRQLLGRNARRPGGHPPLRHFRSVLARGLSTRYRRRRLSAAEHRTRPRSRQTSIIASAFRLPCGSACGRRNSAIIT